jgi:hypothetical protein
VSDGAVEGQLRADADADHHEAELVVEAVGEHPPQVVFDHRIEDRKRGHCGADRHQNFGAGVSPRQRIDGHLRGEGRQQHRAGHGRFRVGVGQPGVQQREGALDAERQQDQPAAGRREPDRIERERSGVPVVQQDSRQQQHARADLDDDVAHAGAVGLLGARGPDQKDGRNGDAFPEDEQRHQIAGEHRAKRAAGVDQAGGLLGDIADMQRVESADEGGQQEDIAEQQAEFVDP